MERRWRKGLTGFAAAAGALMAASSAWAVPTLSPTAGPSGTRVRVTDPACPNRETVALLRFWAERNAAGEVVSGESPEDGRLVVDGPGSGVLTGPPGTYFLQAQCAAGPGLVPTGIGTRLTFVLGDGGGGAGGGGGGDGDGGGSAGAPPPSGDEGGGEQPAGGTAGAPASTVDEPPAQPTRASVRAAEVAARNEERQSGISARQQARDQEVADRAATRAADLEDRQAGIEARRIARAQALAERAEERSAR